MKITINAEHDPGLDSGARGQTGLQEANATKDISLLACKYLNAAGYETQFVQDDSLQNICDVANAFESDLVVSIHCNSATSREAKGTETWYCDGSKEGEKLAACIDKQIVESMHEIDRGTKDAKPHVNGLYVLTNTDAIAVLVETAFLSNEDEEKILASDQGKDDFARAIARGITDYVGGKYE